MIEVTIPRWAYLACFGAAAVVCAVGIVRVSEIEHRGTRLGLGGLLGLSAIWAGAHVGYLAAPTESLQEAFYVAGLVAGIIAVAAWLYFCSAYTGRSFHQNRAIQLGAVILFGAIVTLKLTNPIHGYYFQVEAVSDPFSHLLIQHGTIHWISMGLSYALALIGFFMLFEFLAGVRRRATPLYSILALTGAPILLDLLAAASPILLELTYASLGVSLFAIGVLFVYHETFRTIRVAEVAENPVIVVDTTGDIREVNNQAIGIFPAVASAYGQQLANVLPEVAGQLDEDGEPLRVQVDGDPRYVNVTETPIGSTQAPSGRLLVFEDVTDQELYRRQLERQNERLESFASLISHDLRNPLTVAQGRVELAQETGDLDHLEPVDRALHRMEELIQSILSVARLGQPVEEREPVDIATLAREAWEMIPNETAEFVIRSEPPSVHGDSVRLKQLFENLYRNAIEHGGANVTVTVGELPNTHGFFIEDDGPGIPEDERESVFKTGYSTTEDGTGFGLAIVKEVVEAHDWEIEISIGEDGGARFEIRTSESDIVDTDSDHTS